jgi:hypothetical protein
MHGEKQIIVLDTISDSDAIEAPAEFERRDSRKRPLMFHIHPQSQDSPLQET